MLGLAVNDQAADGDNSSPKHGCELSRPVRQGSTFMDGNVPT